jgi:hypothetical protein
MIKTSDPVVWLPDYDGSETASTLLDKPKKISNQQILLITSLLFGGFVIAEGVGALVRLFLVFLGGCLIYL